LSNLYWNRMLMPFGKKKRFYRNPLSRQFPHLNPSVGKGLSIPVILLIILLSVRPTILLMRLRGLSRQCRRQLITRYLFTAESDWGKRICSMRSEMKSFGIKIKQCYMSHPKNSLTILSTRFNDMRIRLSERNIAILMYC